MKYFIPISQKAFFDRAIFKGSTYIKEKKTLLTENFPEGKKSSILWRLFFHNHSQRKTWKEKLSKLLEGSDHEELIFFFIVPRPEPGAGGCLPNRICLMQWAALWKSNPPAFHLWMSVIWGQWPALYFLNPIWTENVFGLYCVTSPSLSKRPKRGRGWGLAF